MLSLLCVFICVQINGDCLDNSFHIQCTCTCCCEHSYVNSNNADHKNVSHNDYKNTSFLHCAVTCVLSNNILLQTVCHIPYTYMALAFHCMDAQSYHYYQLQSSPQNNFHLHNTYNIQTKLRQY